MIAGAGWFNTGLALVLLVIAVAARAGRARQHRDHMADLAAILLATTIFWAYVEFMPVPDHLGGEPAKRDPLVSDAAWPAPGHGADRLPSASDSSFRSSCCCGAPGKRSRAVVAGACALILLSRVCRQWWLVLPEFRQAGSVLARRRARSWPSAALHAAAVPSAGLRYGRVPARADRAALERTRHG